MLHHKKNKYQAARSNDNESLISNLHLLKSIASIQPWSNDYLHQVVYVMEHLYNHGPMTISIRSYLSLPQLQALQPHNSHPHTTITTKLPIHPIVSVITCLIPTLLQTEIMKASEIRTSMDISWKERIKFQENIKWSNWFNKEYMTFYFINQQWLC